MVGSQSWAPALGAVYCYVYAALFISIPCSVPRAIPPEILLALNHLLALEQVFSVAIGCADRRLESTFVRVTTASHPTFFIVGLCLAIGVRRSATAAHGCPRRMSFPVFRMSAAKNTLGSPVSSAGEWLAT